MRHFLHPSLILSTLAFCALPMMGCGGSNGSTGNIPDFQPKPETETYKYEKPAGTLRLMTYNSYYCKSNTGAPAFTDENTRAFGEVIKALNPDVIAIQELDSASRERFKRYLLQDIQRVAGSDYEIVFGSAAKYDGGKIGCGVMYKKSLQPKSIRQVELPGKEARKLVIISFPQFTFVGTHLDLEARHRQSSIDLLQHELPAYDTAPIFFAGDLNDSPTWKPEDSAFPKIQTLFNIISATTGSLPGQPNVTIDYVLVDKKHASQVEVKQTRVVSKLQIDGTTKDISTVSDHYPVFVDVKLK